jgi:hypothetical protein
VAEKCRGTFSSLSLPLAFYGFSRRARGVLGTTTATSRHGSAAILKRLGGASVEIDGTTIPPYYDPRYKCMMEILRFDSRQPEPRYLGLIDQFTEQLARVRVVARPETPAPASVQFVPAPAWAPSVLQPSFAS